MFRVISKAELLWNGLGGPLLQVIEGYPTSADYKLDSQCTDDLCHNVDGRRGFAVFIVAELFAGNAQSLGELFLRNSHSLPRFSDLFTELALPVHDGFQPKYKIC